jgi:hypothetical protein
MTEAFKVDEFIEDTCKIQIHVGEEHLLVRIVPTIRKHNKPKPIFLTQTVDGIAYNSFDMFIDKSLDTTTYTHCRVCGIDILPVNSIDTALCSNQFCAQEQKLKEKQLVITEHTRICRENAKQYGHSAYIADKCDEANNPICPECPFITK